MARSPTGPTGRSFLIENPTIYRMLRVAPTAMSVMALAICVLASAGVASDRPGDEGTMAHLYQLIVVMEVPIGCMFACVAVRRGLRHNLPVLGAQLALFVATLAAVPILGL